MELMPEVEAAAGPQPCASSGEAGASDDIQPGAAQLTSASRWIRPTDGGAPAVSTMAGPEPPGRRRRRSTGNERRASGSDDLERPKSVHASSTTTLGVAADAAAPAERRRAATDSRMPATPAASSSDRPTALTGRGRRSRRYHAAASQVDPADVCPALTIPDAEGREVTARLVVAQWLRTGSRLRIELEPADLGRVEVACTSTIPARPRPPSRSIARRPCSCCSATRAPSTTARGCRLHGRPGQPRLHACATAAASRASRGSRAAEPTRRVGTRRRRVRRGRTSPAAISRGLLDLSV